MSDLPCPCCGFLTLEEEYGLFVICPVCGWEDDGVQLANPTSAGGANSLSLAEAQAQAIEKYPFDIEVVHGYQRSHRWRPLNAVEISAADKLRAVRHWHTSTVLTVAEAYWEAT